MNPYLLITGDLVPTGGMDRANLALAHYLADRGGAVHVVAHRTATDLARKPNVFVHRVPKLAGSYLLSEPLLDQVGRYWARKIAARGGRVMVNGGNCLWTDTSWVHYVHAAYEPGEGSTLLTRWRTMLRHRLARAVERRLLTQARLVLCNSRRTQKDLIERLGVLEKRTIVIYYGTDPVLFSLVTPAERTRARRQLAWSNDRPVVAFVGALTDRRKGFDTLFAAWQRLCARPAWDCDLAVIGTGAELPLWKKRTRQSGLAERIKFLGFRPDVPQVLAACDALVHPARYEAYGLGVHEALCRGLPSLVSLSAGVAERYPAELHELLIDDPENSEELAGRLLAWRRGLERLQLQVSSFSEALRSYTWDAMATQIVQQVEKAA